MDLLECPAKSFNCICETMMNALAKKYNKDNLSSDEEDKIIENMKWVVKESQRILESTQESTKELAKSHRVTVKEILEKGFQCLGLVALSSVDHRILLGRSKTESNPDLL